MYYNEESKFKTFKKNPNLTITRKWKHNGCPVFHDRGPLITQYLDGIRDTLDKALNEFSEVVVYRFDLRFPHWVDADDARELPKELITNFWGSVVSQVQSAVVQISKSVGGIPYSRVRNIWCKELPRIAWTPHYHAALILDVDLFEGLCQFMCENVIEDIVKEAWARAIGVSVDESPNSVWIPDNNIYRVSNGDENSFEDAYYRLSYLAKSSTKQYHDNSRWFGCTRR